jgi:type I restriction enzyme M protein
MAEGTQARIRRFAQTDVAPPRAAPQKRPPVLTSETKRRLDACRDLLVGKLPLPTDQVELITLALIYKFMDDLDEESVAMGGKRSFFTGPLAQYRWRALLPQTVSGDERVALFSEGVEAIGNAQTGAHLPELFRDIFRNAFLKFRDGRILTLFLNEVNGFAYSHSEELGNAFEYLLQCMGTQGENGQFRTPRHIIDWIVACLDPQPTDKILDPACGTGGFLVSAYRHILQKHTSPGSKLPGDQLGHEQRQRLYANFTGYDITDLMVKLSKVNLFLHQFPSPAIHIYDSLSNDARWSEKADLILANPPFMTPKGGVTPHTKFRVPAKKAEVLFTDYIAEHLTPDGRAGIIVPNGIVATTQNAYVSLRRFLVEDSLVAVVSLPAGVFRPYSGVKTSILLLDKKLARRTDQILFLKIAADGFDLGDQRREIKADDLPEAERVMKAWFKGKLGADFASPLAWKLVEKRELLAEKQTVLMAERWGIEDAVFNESDSAPLSEIAAKISDTISPESMPAGTPCLGLEHVGQGTGSLAGSIPSDPSELKSAKVRFSTGDILYGKLRPNLNKVWLASFSGIASTDFFALRPDRERIEPRLLQFLMLSPQFNEQALSFVRGAQLPRVSYDDLSSIEIPLPPLEEQRRIVAEIEGYQQVIDGARQILAAYRPSFDIDPDWATVKLSEITQGKPKNGYSGQPVAHPTKLKVLSLSATTSGKLDASRFKYLDEEIPTNAPCRCRRGDIYLQRGNTAELVGTAALFDIDAEDFIYPDLMIRVRADEEKALTSFLLCTLQSPAVREYLKRNATGAAGSMPKINQGIVENIPIPLPPLPEQRQIVAELDAEAAEVAAVRALIPRYEAKIQRVLARVWGTAT